MNARHFGLRALGTVQGFVHSFTLRTPSASELLPQALEIVCREGGLAIRRNIDLIRLQRGDEGWHGEA